MSVFVQNSKMKIFLFCFITFEPIINKTCQAPQIDHHNLNFVKDYTHVVKKWPEKVLQSSFMNSNSFQNGLYIERF